MWKKRGERRKMERRECVKVIHATMSFAKVFSESLWVGLMLLVLVWTSFYEV